MQNVLNCHRLREQAIGVLTVLKHTSRLSGCVLSVVGPIKGIHGITGVKWYRFESMLAEKLVHRALVTTGPGWIDL